MSGSTLTQPDVTLLLDLDGVIRRATLSPAIAGETLTEWVGRPWSETAGTGGGEQVRRIVEDARRSGVSAFCPVSQRLPSGQELPMEFTAVRLGGKEGLIAIGRTLQAVSELQSRLVAAQRAREQDYWKLREVETRCRLLFDASHEPVLVLSVDGLRVLEANPAAIRALGVAPGWEFLAEVAPADIDAFQGVLMRAREQGRTPGMMMHLGPGRVPWLVRASLMVSASGPVFLLQLGPLAAPPLESGPVQTVPVQVVPVHAVPEDSLIERLPDGFVAIDADGTVRRVNRAFLDLAEVATEQAALGKPLGRWLGTPGADMPMLLAAVQQHRTVRRMATRMTGERGGQTEVDVSAALHAEAPSPLVGVLIRDVTRHVPAGAETGRIGALLGSYTEQVGHTPLLQLVRETTAALERHYIEAALKLARGNRTQAAQLLGLSRQSLYVKLNRYGLDGTPSGGAPPPPGEEQA